MTPVQRVAVLGAGPAGMAAALGILKAGHEVVLYERYREARPAGNILNLWPPPLKALRALGVDISDFGAPTDSEFRSISGRVGRAEHPPLEAGSAPVADVRPAALHGGAVADDRQAGLGTRDVGEREPAEDVQPVLPLGHVAPQGAADQ